ncbi:hypothetical protein AAY473_024065 [Plecturocebus cupreus]
MPIPHRVGPSQVRCACCKTLSPQRFQLLFSLWGWDQPRPSIPYTPHREALCWGTGKTAAPAKRVALATRVAPLPGIYQSVGNKNSSERGAKCSNLPFTLEGISQQAPHHGPPRNFTEALPDDEISRLPDDDVSRLPGDDDPTRSRSLVTGAGFEQL